MVMASEVGVYDTDPQNIVHKGRLKPGRMLLVDTKEKLYIKDEELKLNIARSRPYKVWLQEQVTMDELRDAHAGPVTFGVDTGGVNGVLNGINGVDGAEIDEKRKQPKSNLFLQKEKQFLKTTCLCITQKRYWVSMHSR